MITGLAGFIGFHLGKRLLDRGDEVVGLDNLSSYYDVSLKEARLAQLGYERQGGRFYKLNLADREGVARLFADERPNVVVNLAAQAGVRYSLQNPYAYAESNLMGFVNVLEDCRHWGVKHLVFASSSSVYGANTKTPFSVHDRADATCIGSVVLRCFWCSAVPTCILELAEFKLLRARADVVDRSWLDRT